MRSLFRTTALVLFSALLWAFTPAYSATLMVANCNDRGAGSLRDTIAGASPGDTITFNLNSGSRVILTSGELRIDKDLTIDGSSVPGLTIDANRSSRVFYIDRMVKTLSLRSLTIANGHAPDGPDGTTQGQNAGSGGGIYSLSSQGSLNLSNCILSGNSGGDGGDGDVAGSGGHGGGIYSNGVLSLTNCILSGNSGGKGGEGILGGQGGSGGGIFSMGNLSLTNCILSGNSAGRGGWGSSGSSGGYGGGIVSQGSLNLTNCILSENSGGDGGDGDVAGFGGHGGGIVSYGNLSLTNCTLSRNFAGKSGWGSSDGYGGNGGGISFRSREGNFQIVNSILWQNKPNQLDYLNFPSITCSLVEGGYSGEGNISADPLFADASKGDYRPKPGSPCINKGNNNAPALPSIDLDDKPRIFNGIVDMGAYEAISILPGTGTLYGKVVDAQTGEGIGLATVSLYGIGDRSSPVAQSSPAPDGSYLIENITPGKYVVSAVPKDVRYLLGTPVTLTLEPDTACQAKVELVRSTAAVFSSSPAMASLLEAKRLTKILDYDARRKLTGYSTLGYNDKGELSRLAFGTPKKKTLGSLTLKHTKDGFLQSIRCLDSSRETLLEERFTYTAGFLEKVEDHFPSGDLLGYRTIAYKKGMIKSTSYRDGSDRLLSGARFLYNERGFLSRILLSSAASENEGKIVLLYDKNSRLIEERFYGAGQKLIGCKKHEYDNKGIEIRESYFESERMLSSTAYEYNDRGLLIGAAVANASGVTYKELRYE